MTQMVQETTWVLMVVQGEIGKNAGRTSTIRPHAKEVPHGGQNKWRMENLWSNE